MQGVLPARVPALPTRPEPRRHWLGRQFPALAYASVTPVFRSRRHPGRASLTHCSTVLSITVRHWRLMDGSEKLRSADVHQQFERGVEVTRRTVKGQGVALPADITTALDMQPPQNLGRSGVRHTLRH
jgi:hypothetical protein